jgi:creatinine amidohydrolase
MSTQDVAAPGECRAECRAELLSFAEVEARIAEAPLVYLPLGTLEYHAAHLPIGLDALTGHGVACAAARITGGVVLPPVYQGFGGSHGPYPWTIMMDGGDVLSGMLTATLSRMQDLGVKRAVVFSGHYAPEQLDLIDGFQQRWNADETNRLKVVATAVNRCPDSPFEQDHAGVFETTLLSGLHPELVHVDRLPSLADHPAADPGGDPHGTHRHDPENPLWGIFGPDPREADLSRGPELVEHLGRWLAGVAGTVPALTSAT